MAAGSLTVRVVSPARVVYRGEADSLVAPAWDGEVGILRGHAPMITLLGVGRLAIRGAAGGSREMFVAGGVLKVEGDVVTLLTEYAGDTPPPDWHEVHLDLDDEIRDVTPGRR